MTLSLRILCRLNVAACRLFSGSGLVAAPDNTVVPKEFVQPHIDLEKKLEEISNLKENVERRKLKIDPVKLKSLWDFFKYLEVTKLQLEKRKQEIVDHMKDLKKFGNDGEAKVEIEKFKVEGRVVRENLKTLMKAFWEVEEKVIMKGLSLPNELHKDTPDGSERVIHEFKERPAINQEEGHVAIGQSLGLLDFIDPSMYYLKNTAALFELGCISHFTGGLKEDDFIPFSNPDFVRSIIVEGCRTDHNDRSSVFTVGQTHERINQGYRLHLVGGASLFAFCAFHAKHTTSFSSLPLKYYTTGRQYSPCPVNQDDDSAGLFSTWQRSAVEVFILTADDYDEMMAVFHRTLATVINLYEQIGHHFRVAYLSASSLQSWECLRASIQMYSCREQRYVEVGKISISGKYICQRLLMSYQMSEKDKKTRFMKMVTGTVVDVPKLLACLLEEQNPNEKFVIPDRLNYCGGV